MVLNKWLENKPSWVRHGLNLTIAYLIIIAILRIFLLGALIFPTSKSGFVFIFMILHTFLLFPTGLIFNIDFFDTTSLPILVYIIQAFLFFVVGAFIGYLVGIIKRD